MFWSVFVSLCDWMSIGLFWILYRLDGQSSSRWCEKWQWSWETIYGAWREKFNRNDTVPISMYHDWGIWATECRPVFCVRLKVLCLTNFVFNNYESTIKNVGCVLYSITPNLSSGSNAISHCFLSGSCLLRLPFFVVFFSNEKASSPLFLSRLNCCRWMAHGRESMGWNKSWSLKLMHTI